MRNKERHSDSNFNQKSTGAALKDENFTSCVARKER